MRRTALILLFLVAGPLVAQNSATERTGVATAAGVFFALAPMPMAVAFSVFIVVVLATGYVSLGSLLSALALPPMLAYDRGIGSPLFIVSAAIAAFVFWTHRANIGRLRRGEEHRFGKRGHA